MAIMTLATFKKKTAKTFSRRNGAIGTIDSALRAYHSPPATKDKLTALNLAVEAFKNEKNLKFAPKGGTFTDSKWESKGGVAELAQQVQDELGSGSLVSVASLTTGRGNLRQVRQGAVSGFPSGQTFRIGENNTRMEGWAYSPFSSAEWPWTSEVVSGHKGPLTLAETSRITEALRRTKTAISLAHEAMIKIKKLSGFPATPTIEQQTYIDYFGTFDADRIKRVTRNFTVLKLAIDKGPRIVDLRDTDYGLSCYAACFRGNLGTTDTGTGQVSVLSALTVFLGRAFFKAGSMNYGDTTDATVGTLIHEFAHGAVDAVDVPPVNSVGAWTHARESDDPGDRNFGSSTDNSIQASTIPLDKLLASFKPGYAVVNADNYGQFAAALLQRTGG